MVIRQPEPPVWCIRILPGVPIPSLMVRQGSPVPSLFPKTRQVNGLTSGHASQVALQHVTAHPGVIHSGCSSACMHSPSMVASSRSASMTNAWSALASSDTRSGDQPADDGGHRAVAPVSFRGQERPDPGRVLEGHPDARVHGALLVQRQEFAQQG